MLDPSLFDNVNFDPFIWRPILAQITTLHEIDEYWTICDLADANEALDIKAEIEEKIGNNTEK